MPPVSTVRINGPALRELRTSKGVAIGRLAKKTGRHPKSIGRLEQGDGKPASLVFANQIARALRAKVADFALPEDDAQSGEVAA